MRENKKYKRFFDKEWCPLFGDLPNDEDFYPVSLVCGCVDIIISARGLLGIPDGFSPKWLKKGYPKEDLETARTIFKSYDSVSQHAMEKAYQRSDGVVEGRHDTYTNWRFAVDFVRSFHLGMFFDDEFNDYGILAVFAIAEAWDTLRNLLYYEESEGAEINIRNTLRAQQLLMLATEKAKQEDYDLGVNLRRKLKKFSYDYGQRVKEDNRSRNESWFEEYKKIKKNPEKTYFRPLTLKLYEILKPDVKYKTFYKILLAFRKSEEEGIKHTKKYKQKAK